MCVYVSDVIQEVSAFVVCRNIVSLGIDWMK